jgi:predicted methyltransferase
VPAENIQRRYRFRVALFLLCGFAVVLILGTGYQALQTLVRLDEIEQERDRWQRPAQILQALGVQTGNVVIDLGCGSGYFALKLAPVVGSKGKVLAIDIRELPLLFLWTRAALRGYHNLTVVLSYAKTRSASEMSELP